MAQRQRLNMTPPQPSNILDEDHQIPIDLTEAPQETLLERVIYNGDKDMITNFVCPVCQDLLNNPRECSKCRNAFCKNCIDRWQQRQTTQSTESLCPMRCRGVTFMKISVPFKHQLENLFQVRCKNQSNGCKDTVSYGCIDQHQKSCAYELVHCPNNGCSQWIIRKDMVHHKDNQCCFGLQICTYCRREILRLNFNNHLLSDCQEVTQVCDLCGTEMAKRGMLFHQNNECLQGVTQCVNYPQCQSKFIRKFQDQHLQKDCEFQLLICHDICKLPLPRGQFQDHNCARELLSVYQKVLEENQELKNHERILKEENQCLLDLVENTANRIQNMEGMIQAQRSSLEINSSVRMGAALAEENKDGEQTVRNSMKLELVKQSELLPESTIDILCYIKQTGHIAVTGLTHPCISIYQINNNQSQFELVQDVGERTTPVAGLCEIEAINCLVSIGIDLTLVFYEIRIDTNFQPKREEVKTTKTCFSCFQKKKKENGANEAAPQQVSYIQTLVVQNAHDSEINCIRAVPSLQHWQVHFVTGANKEIKLWSKGTCVATLPSAHNSQIYQIDILICPVTYNNSTIQGEEAGSTFICSGSRDKTLKLWKIARHPLGHLCLNQHAVQTTQSQINCVMTISHDLILLGLNDGNLSLQKLQAHQVLTQINISKQFTQSCLQIQPLAGYKFESYPYVAMAGMVSKLLIFDVQRFTVMKTIRILVSNWHMFKGISALDDDHLGVGCLDGSIKLYKALNEN